jgi:hypothetical protein
MNNQPGRTILRSAAILFLLHTLAAASPIDGNQCTKSAKAYEEEQYRVNDVRIDAPLKWLFRSVDRELNAIISDPSMPIRKGALFRKIDEDEGFIKVHQSFPELTVGPNERIAVRISRPTLQNCDPQAKTLDVVYRVYTLSFSYYLSRAFETGKKDEVKRSVVDTGATKRLADYFPQPQIGYNQSRNLFGGTRLTIRQPADLLDNFVLGLSASSRGLVANGQANGARDFQTGFIRHLEYQSRYAYSDTPTTATALREGMGLTQVIAATKTLGSRELILRFGSSFEAGNQQTDLTPAQVLPGDVPRSPYGSLKAFAGGTMRFGRHALKASYGIQLGSARKSAQVDYIKQIFDTGANFRFLPRDHRPITLDLQFTAGAIQNRGLVPTADRFFGGNSEQNFIASDTWTIRSDPFIRSFPQNQLAQTSAAGFVGGDHFFSANVTTAVTVWGRPLVPREILKDPDFNQLVDFEFGTAETSLKLAYLSSTPEFHKVGEMVNPIGDKLAAISSFLTDLESKHVSSEIDGQIQLCRADIDDVNETVTKIKKDLEGGSPQSADIRTLVVGFPDKRPPIPSSISELTDDLSDLKDMANIPNPAAIQTLIQELDGQRAAMARSFLDLNQSAVAQKAAARAQQDLKYPRRVFNEVTREANLIAVSPVFIFDAARLRQGALSSGSVRYGIGGGVRFSIVSLELTAGYAFNPGRKPWERRGAMLFTMEVSNLFR